MIVFALSICLSAFLLFQIQPMIGKLILPWFGGTSAVWSTVMLFFQILLTGGYAYSHYLIGRIKVSRQWKVHVALLALSVGLIVVLGFLWVSPISPPARWKPLSGANPIGHIFMLLAVSVGLPYFMLSTNSPLIQSWFSRLFPERSPYRLYALSNLGSLLALVSYPVIFEPLLALRWQGWIWAGLYIVYSILTGYASFIGKRSKTPTIHPTTGVSPRPTNKTIALWIALSGTASLMLLAVTNQITQEVAATPFLWILPLTLYLLSFILAFENERWYNRPIFSALLLISTVGFIALTVRPSIAYVTQIGVYSVLAFACFMICHGELYRLRPQPDHLTTFYLVVSIGGAVGGIFVNFVAPFIFKGYWELTYGLALVGLLLAAMMFIRPAQGSAKRPRFLFNLLVGTIVVITMIFSVYYPIVISSSALMSERNFYGVVRVKRTEQYGSQAANILVHGRTEHGLQFIAAEEKGRPTAYFTAESGIGLTIQNHPKRNHHMKVGVLGLGIGTLAAYGQPGDEYRLYEINPSVIKLAEGYGEYFSFLQDSQADVSVVLGDARIALERELAQGENQQFDLLILDAFSSGSIPVHLTTKEAVALYLQHLSAEGILAANISNNYLDLVPVFKQLASYFDLDLVIIETPGNNAIGGAHSLWALMAQDPSLLNIPAITERASTRETTAKDINLWTDDYSNLFQILK
jgi:hypothetical protein